MHLDLFSRPKYIHHPRFSYLLIFGFSSFPRITVELQSSPILGPFWQYRYPVFFCFFFYVFNSATSCIWTSYWFSPFHRPKREDFYVMISTTKIYILYCFMESFFYLKLKKIIISQNVAKYLPCIRNLRHKGVSTPHQTSSPKYMSYMF